MIVLVVLLLVLCLCISIIAYRGTVSMSTVDITKKEYGKRVVTDASKVSLTTTTTTTTTMAVAISSLSSSVSLLHYFCQYYHDYNHLH